MTSELLLRFVFGGVIVSAFAVIGDIVRPKSFAGLFAAAPSVALASLGLAFHTHTAERVVLETRSMLIGAVALGVYSLVVGQLLKRRGWNTVVAAGASWAVWAAVAFGLWAVVLGGAFG